MQNKNARRRTSSNVLRDYFVSHGKSWHALQKEGVWEPYLAMLLYGTCAIWVKQTQNLPETSRGVSYSIVFSVALVLHSPDSGTWPTFRKSISVIIVSSRYQIFFKWNTAVWPIDIIKSVYKHFSHLKRLNGTHMSHIWLNTWTWWGDLLGGGPVHGPLGLPLNQALFVDTMRFR